MSTFVSLESFLEEENTAPVVVDETQLTDGCEVSLEHIEIEDDVRVPADADMAQLEFQFQMATASEASLERLEARLEKSLENGGLSTNFEAEAFADQYQAATESFGSHVVEIPTVESFAEEGMAEPQTRVATENVKEMAAKAGKALKSLLDALINQVKKLAQQYLTRGGRARKALEALKKIAGTVKGNPVEKQVSISNARYITIPGKVNLVDYGKRVVAGSSGLEKALKEMAGQMSRIDSGNPAGSLQALENNEQSLYKAIEGMFDASTTASETLANKAGFKAGSYQKIVVSQELPGGGYVVVAIPEADSGRPVAVKHIFGEGEKADSKVDAVKASDLGKVIDQGLAVLDTHDALVAEMQKLSGIAKDVASAGQKAAKAVGKIKDKQTEAGKLVGFIKDMKPRCEVTYVVHKALATQCALQAAAHADLCKASIKNLKSEGGKDPKPEDKDNKDPKPTEDPAPADDKDKKPEENNEE